MSSSSHSWSDSSSWSSSGGSSGSGCHRSGSCSKKVCFVKHKRHRKAYAYKPKDRLIKLCAKLSPDACFCNKGNCNGCGPNSHKPCDRTKIHRSGYGTASFTLNKGADIGTVELVFRVEYSKMSGKATQIKLYGPVTNCKHAAEDVIDLASIYRVSIGVDPQDTTGKGLDSYIVGSLYIPQERADELVNSQLYIAVQTTTFPDCAGEIRGLVKPAQPSECGGYAGFFGDYGYGCRPLHVKKASRKCFEQPSCSSSSSSSCSRS